MQDNNHDITWFRRVLKALFIEWNTPIHCDGHWALLTSLSALIDARVFIRLGNMDYFVLPYVSSQVVICLSWPHITGSTFVAMR